jgi:ectoine hydroxylase-related dioxygenase (phytanoyl-CoA dioxygenase family)
MLKLLKAKQVDDFERDGFTSPVTVLSRAETQYYRNQCLEFERGLPDSDIIWRRMLHIHFEWAYRLASHPAVLDAVEDLLGPDIMVLSTILFSKPPDQTHYVSWHQDGRPMVRKGVPMKSLTAWIAMSESDEQNGCLRVIPGTHKNGYHRHAAVADSANMLRRGEYIDLAIEESQAMSLVLRPGQMSLHHVDTVHGSEPNRSGEPRIGFTIRFAAAEVEIARELDPRACVRGNPRTDLYSVFTGTPHADMSGGLESLKASVNRMLAQEKSMGIRY